MKILIADDEPGVARRLERLLRHLPGVDVVNHRTAAADAILALLDLQPDLLILDHHFPGGSGYDIARKVEQYSPGTRIVMFSAYLTQPDRMRYERAGVDGFHDKTTGLDELIDEVQTLAQSAYSAAHTEPLH